MTKTDMQLTADVEAELRWDPRVNALQIGVTVDRGAVSLHGIVDTYAEKWAAEEAVKRVGGVRTIAEHLSVEILPQHARSDAELAAAVHQALTWDVLVPKTVTATVAQGVVTLIGKVTWNFQRTSAERSIERLAGIVAVFNSIALRPEASTGEVIEKVQAALKRQATADGKSIRVGLEGSIVTLTGYASSWTSVRDAANAAWAVPGVTQVLDQLTVAS
jgi:osmotically-inducible protein OsmY